MRVAAAVAALVVFAGAGCGSEQVDGRLRIVLVPLCQPAFDQMAIDTFCIQIENLGGGVMDENCSSTIEGAQLRVPETEADPVRVVVEGLSGGNSVARGRSVPVRLSSGDERTLTIPVTTVNRFGLLAADQPECTGLPYPAADHTANVFPSGHVAVVGTSQEAEATRSAFLLDPMTTEADSLPTVPTLHRSAHSATLLHDGRLVILGGLATNGPAPRDIVILRGADAMLADYDQGRNYPAELSFVQNENGLASVRRTLNAALFHGDQVLVNDGASEAEMFLGSDEISEFIRLETHENPFPESNGRPVSVVPISEDLAVILGGQANHVGFITVEKSRRDVAFEPLNVNIALRSNPEGLKLPDGRAMFIGGFIGGMASESPVLVVNSHTRRLSQVQLERPEAFPQHGFTANVFPNGYVLVAGGDSQNAGFTAGSTWFLRPNQERPGGYEAIEGPPLVMPRTGHTTSVLPDGRILVIGGRSAGAGATDGQVATSAEVITFDSD